MAVNKVLGELRSKPVFIRDVWEGNLEAEMSFIRNMITAGFRVITIDTEFPGTIYKQPGQMDSFTNYKTMKDNIDQLNIIQLGLTLSDSYGNLPGFPTQSYIWQFNFRDFDIDRDPYDPISIELLKQQGIDFMKNKAMGVDSRKFAYFLLKSGMLNNFSILQWLTFHGAYDFGFLIKLIHGGNKLPNDLYSFSRVVSSAFGIRVYDMKSISKHYFKFQGGLEKLAKELNIKRIAGKSHQAGSDSLLTMQTYMKLQEICVTMRKTTLGDFNGFEGVLYGLEVPRRTIDMSSLQLQDESMTSCYTDERVPICRGPRSRRMPNDERLICRGPRANQKMFSRNKLIVM